jgi:hypothetical protein
MRTLISLACAAALLGGCAIVVTPNDGDFHVYSAFDSKGDTVEGNGVAARDTRAVAGLQGLEVGGGMVVDVRVGPAPSLVVEADGNLLPLIRTEAAGDTLRVTTDEPLRSRNPIRISYTTPRLSELRTGGSGHVTVTGLNGAPLAVSKNGSGVTELAGRVARFDAQSNGSGRLEAQALDSGSARVNVGGSGYATIGRINGDYAELELNGSGHVRAGGAVRALTVRVNGSGNADLSGLASERADLVSNGSGGITANVKQSLVAQASGSGGVRVYGNPAQRSISGKSVRVLD